jgi:uncharacterized protein
VDAVDSELVLRAVFTHLVERGLPLGVRDYLDALRALRAGFGGSQRDRLHWLCRTLWARSEAEARTITLLFDEIPLSPTDSPGSADPEDSARKLRGDDDVSALEREQEPGDVERAAPAAPVLGVSFSPLAEGGVGVPRARSQQEREEVFVLTPRPVVSLRGLTVIWRRFRMATRTGPGVELNIAATIEAQCRNGVLDQPVLVPARRNQARLVVLMDASPSMLPWPALDRLLTASLAEGRLGEWAVYYFDNVPSESLYRDPDFLRPISLERVFRKHYGSTLLVVSDAGAARGCHNTTRAPDTARFLSHVARHWRPVVWINPMPRARWRKTSAEAIRALAGVRMFELTEDGLIGAVDVLRGHGRDLGTAKR